MESKGDYNPDPYTAVLARVADLERKTDEIPILKAEIEELKRQLAEQRQEHNAQLAGALQLTGKTLEEIREHRKETQALIQLIMKNASDTKSEFAAMRLEFVALRQINERATSVVGDHKEAIEDLRGTTNNLVISVERILQILEGNGKPPTKLQA